MTLRCSVVLLVVVGLSTAAFAQDDDDLTPLAPLGKPKPKPKPKPRPKVVKPKAKPAPVVLDDLAPISPIVTNGELSVLVAGGLSGAVLAVDGKDLGGLPLPPLSIVSGEHTVTVKRPGYAAFVKKVLVSGGKSVEVEAKLTAVAAVLSVTSDVPGAQVLLNGRAIGTVPLSDVEVAPGPAEVVVMKEGFREDTQKINFVAGKEYPIVVKFQAVAPTTLTASDRPVDTQLTPVAGGAPLPGVALAPAQPITSKWYFWAGIAAVAIGAGVGVGVGVANQKKPWPAKEICGQDCDGCIGLACEAGFRPMGSF